MVVSSPHPFVQVRRFACAHREWLYEVWQWVAPPLSRCRRSSTCTTPPLKGQREHWQRFLAKAQLRSFWTNDEDLLKGVTREPLTTACSTPQHKARVKALPSSRDITSCSLADDDYVMTSPTFLTANHVYMVATPSSPPSVDVNTFGSDRVGRSYLRILFDNANPK